MLANEIAALFHGGAAVRQRDVIFDLTRLATRFSRPAPNGIDRVDIGYAEHFLSEGRGGQGALFGPAGLRAVDNRAGREIVQAVAGHWREPGSAEEDEAYVRLMARLEGHDTEARRHPPARRKANTLRSLGRLMRHGRIVGRSGLFPGRSLSRTVPRGATYLNINQFPLWLDWYFRWLDRRPDVKAVFFIHDLLPITYPEFFPASEAQRHEGRMEVLARRGHGIIVASDDTRRALERYFWHCNRPLPPTCVIPLPPSASFTHSEGVAAPPTRRPYFVTVGTIEPRKTQLLLLNIWRELAQQLGDRTPMLLLVGARGWDNENVVDMLERCRTIEPFVVEIPGLSTPALGRLMAGARAVLLPTLAEGYGLPAVEAQAAGAPLIVSDRLGLRHPLGGRTIVLDPLDGPGWRDAIAAHACSESVPGMDEVRPKVEATSSWKLHIEHAEQFIQSL